MIHVYQAVVVAMGIGVFILIGYILKRLRGDDGPMGHVDGDTASNHLWSRWF